MPEKKRYVEGIHFSFFEYAGSNIAHYYFNNESDFNKIKATRLSNKVFLFSDNDNNKNSVRDQQLNDQMKENDFLSTVD